MRRTFRPFCPRRVTRRASSPRSNAAVRRVSGRARVQRQCNDRVKTPDSREDAILRANQPSHAFEPGTRRRRPPRRPSGRPGPPRSGRPACRHEDLASTGASLRATPPRGRAGSPAERRQQARPRAAPSEAAAPVAGRRLREAGRRPRRAARGGGRTSAAESTPRSYGSGRPALGERAVGAGEPGGDRQTRVVRRERRIAGARRPTARQLEDAAARSQQYRPLPRPGRSIRRQLRLVRSPVVAQPVGRPTSHGRPVSHRRLLQRRSEPVAVGDRHAAVLAEGPRRHPHAREAPGGACTRRGRRGR